MCITEDDAGDDDEDDDDDDDDEGETVNGVDNDDAMDVIKDDGAGGIDVDGIDFANTSCVRIWLTDSSSVGEAGGVDGSSFVGDLTDFTEDVDDDLARVILCTGIGVG